MVLKYLHIEAWCTLLHTFSCTLHEILFDFGIGKNNNNYYIGTNFAH